MYLPDDIPSKNGEKSKKCYNCGECNFQTKKEKGVRLAKELVERLEELEIENESLKKQRREAIAHIYTLRNKKNL